MTFDVVTLFPSMFAGPLQDSILVRETNTFDLHEYRDTFPV